MQKPWRLCEHTCFLKRSTGCVPMDESCVSPVYFKKKKHNIGLAGIIYGCKIINLYLL